MVVVLQLSASSQCACVSHITAVSWIQKNTEKRITLLDPDKFWLCECIVVIYTHIDCAVQLRL